MVKNTENRPKSDRKMTQKVIKKWPIFDDFGHLSRNAEKPAFLIKSEPLFDHFWSLF